MLFSSTSIEVRLSQSRNAHCPMVVTLSGMVIEVRLSQLANAHTPMEVTLSGMVKAVSVLPIAYWIRVDPSFEYKFLSMDL